MDRFDQNGWEKSYWEDKWITEETTTDHPEQQVRLLPCFLFRLTESFIASHPLRGDGILMHETQHKRRKDALDRLARIEGHVHGLRKMVEEDKTCPDILIQVAAVRAALSKVSRIV